MIEQSFADCPNHCHDGYIIDPYTHNKKKCEYCEQKRLSLLTKVDDSIDIDTELRLPYSVIGATKFEPSSIWTEKVLSTFTEDSIAKCTDELQTLIERASIGDTLPYSVLFNLGQVSNIANFVGVFLRRAFKSGNTVAPFVTTEDIIASVSMLSSGIDNPNVIKYMDLISAKYLVLRISGYSESNTIYYAFSLIKSRAEKGNATVIFTDTIRQMLFKHFDMTAPASFYNPKYVSISMKDKEKEAEQVEEDTKKPAPQKKSQNANLTSDEWNSFISNKNGATF